MVESDDPLEAGLEIMCQPPGKKLSTLSLLSGGEQTLDCDGADLCGVFGQPGTDLCSGRGRRAVGRCQRDAVSVTCWTRCAARPTHAF